MIVKLTTGETVHIREVWNHKVDKTFNSELANGVTDFKMIPLRNNYAAYEAVFPLLIERIEPEKPYTLSWLDDLPPEDYLAIQRAVDSIPVKKGEGKKIVEAVKANLFSTMGTEIPLPPEYEEYKLCKMFRCLPRDLDEMEQHTLELYCSFMRLEAEAAKIESARRSFHA